MSRGAEAVRVRMGSREGRAKGGVSDGRVKRGSEVRGMSSSSTRGTWPKTLLSFLEERTRAARCWEESVFEVGGGGGKRTGDMVLVPDQDGRGGGPRRRYKGPRCGRWGTKGCPFLSRNTIIV